MILYFSGTGNSKFVAESLASLTSDTAFPIADSDPETLSFVGETLGFVFPIYSWGVPPIVLEFVSRLSKSFVDSISGIPFWTVMTCGDETGDAPAMWRNACGKSGLNVDAVWSVIMPNTYVLLPGFDVDDDAVREDKQKRAIERVEALSDRIMKGDLADDFFAGKWPRLKTRLIFPLFKKWGIDARKWHADRCIGCGQCEKACPVGNISLTEIYIDGHKEVRPVWGDNCTSCLACYHKCPVRTVNYGRISRNKGHYFCKMDNFTSQLK